MIIEDFSTIAPNVRVASEQALIDGAWVDDAKAALQEAGAVVLRGPIFRHDGAELALSQLDGELLDDAFWSTPRSKVGGKTLTATEYPSPRTIALHTEMAYMSSWPRFVGFHSIDVADEGGETTICDIEKVSAQIGPERLAVFHEKGVSYHRTFQKGVDIQWQKAFQTENRADVEKMGKRLGMSVRWLPNDVLQTSHTAQGTITAEDGTPLYFNQSHLFHPASLEPAVRETLEKLGDRMPRRATFGDGTDIPDDDILVAADAFVAHQTKMCWQPGDILILDNMRFAHGRLPFKGSRKLHVSLAQLVTSRARTPLSFSAGQPASPARGGLRGMFQRLGLAK